MGQTQGWQEDTVVHGIRWKERCRVRLSGSGWFFVIGEPGHCIRRTSVAFVVDENALGHFTDLRDKNGKEIFEPDVENYQYDHVGLMGWNNDESKILVRAASVEILRKRERSPAHQTECG